ncbi:PREDICTED: uncharacterized protein LOC104756274 isoform X2 [Camelina sativa]|uniref:Uncharacterized protein LOC104740630 isoform X3 n=1 Tax=Camelina sativa TaxID=90675 RepID=A0ABM0VQB8_CAMSA|nr:PREDICTED: uncharacterized protein LOC104740630 isoform X3 [Camelina sativa]XP_010477140.1 PREDICTED: uncharacterized protein LOC104756274 isoform X2 [Camelina sativa]
MLEAVDSSGVVNGGFPQIQSFYGDCSSEEELSVLPRHTKVVVTGNNRTKSVLVGLQGVVKKAVGLGGWHWLVLTNGIEVKLQRNALSVLEHPTGLEEDDDLDFESTQRNGSDMTSEDTLKPHKSKQRGQRSRSSHKTLSRSLSSDSQSKSSGFTPPENMKVDLSKLEMPALLKYWQHFNLVDAIPNPSKEQLIDIVQRHFMSQQMDELQVIMGFVQAAKRMKKACKLQSKEARNTDLNCIS